MLSSKRICPSILITAVAVTGALTMLPAGAQAEGKRDNSGRQLAVVVPGMPHPTPLPTVHYGAKVSDLSSGGDRSSSDSFKSSTNPLWTQSDRADASKNRGPRVISAPTELSPEIKQAVEKGAMAAQGLSKIAVRRASDTAAWLALLWREMNEYPRVSPSTPVLEPQPLGPMKPLTYAGKDHQMFFTNERRIKIVVGR